MIENRIISLTILACLIAAACFAQDNGDAFEYASPYYKIQLTGTAPFVRYFAADGLGKGDLSHNPIQWKPTSDAGVYELSKRSATEAEIREKGADTTLWTFSFDEKTFTATSRYRNGRSNPSLDFRFGKEAVHATLLGIMTERNKTQLPAVLHLPDMGTFQVTSQPEAALVDYAASRQPGENYIAVSLLPATSEQGKLRYTLAATAIYPRFDGVEAERYDGYCRDYLNLFQVNPSFRVLANNSCSDPCAFTLFLSSMLARHTPPLAGNLTALDLVRMSIERYLTGMKAYGMVGYTNIYEGVATAGGWPSPTNSLDAYPSLVITACNYIEGAGDTAWAARHYPQLKTWMDDQMKRDYDGNGLVEYELSGDAGSWDGVMRPANWWDTIGFGHEDAFSNALTYGALELMKTVATRLGNQQDAARYAALAEKMNAAYFPTFHNPETGVLAGWKSNDGKLHDYCFLVVNSMAVYYGLVPQDKTAPVMTALWNKMQETGYRDFTIGVPGNLVSVRREDYTHKDPRWGGGEKEDGSDAFQRYENGGASLNWSYFTLKAFKIAGLEAPLKTIEDGILEGIANGNFQGDCDNGMTKDWRAWDGACWGYEGFLCDGYLALLAINPEDR